jgi:hypothetical protein
MVNRCIGITLVGFMLLANVGIFVRDVLPHWVPNDVPPNDAQMLSPGDERFVQVGIYNDDGVRIGTSWTSSQRKAAGEFVGVNTVTIFGPVTLPAITIPRLRIDSDIILRTSTQRVDEVNIKVYGVDVPIQLKCEAMPTGEFPCHWTVGPQSGDVVLDGELPAMLGDVVRPFDRLPNLYVGQTWRLKLVDPLKALLPQLENSGIEIEPLVFRVTGREKLVWSGREVEVFVVDGGETTAYVDDDGRVLRQEVSVPLLGRLVLIDEPYSDRSREHAAFSTP